MLGFTPISQSVMILGVNLTELDRIKDDRIQSGEGMISLVGKSQDTFQIEQRRARRKKILLSSLAGILVTAIILFVLAKLYLNHKYDGYQVERSISVKDSNAMQYLSYAGGVIRYSRDGVAAMGASGKDLWNGSYDMDRPAVDTCGTSAVVADIGGKTLYVHTEKGQGTEMSMDYEILQACISGQGVVAVMLEDTDSNMIHVYDPYASGEKLLVEIPTNVETGFPVSMDISQDGTSMTVSYVSMFSGVVESRVAFYNFTNVGENTNCLVGAQEYKDRVVSEVRYLGDSKVCLFSEKGYSIWGNLKKPSEIAKQDFKQDILSAFCDEDYVGVVLAGNKEGKGQMRVFNLQGKEQMSRKIDTDYSHIALYGKEIMINTADSCDIYLVNGVHKWDCSLKDHILHFLPSKGMNCYFLIEDNEIKKIKLKNNEKGS